MSVYMERVLDAVRTERDFQDRKWGSIEGRHDEPWLQILVEEVGEVAKAELEHGDLEAELVQVAAVAVAWIERLQMSRIKRV